MHVTFNKDLLEYDSEEFTDSLNSPSRKQYISHDKLVNIRNTIKSGF